MIYLNEMTQTKSPLFKMAGKFKTKSTRIPQMLLLISCVKRVGGEAIGCRRQQGLERNE